MAAMKVQGGRMVPAGGNTQGPNRQQVKAIVSELEKMKAKATEIRFKLGPAGLGSQGLGNTQIVDQYSRVLDALDTSIRSIKAYM